MSNTTLIPEGRTTGAVEGAQQPMQEKDVSLGMNQAGAPGFPGAPSGNGSDQEQIEGVTVSLTPAVAKAARKWAAVLEFPCPSKACQNLKGQPCSFHDGRLRQKPHDQRIEAATAAGAYVAGQRVPAFVVGVVDA